MALVVSSYNLLVRADLHGVPRYEAKWRRDGAQVKRRLGPAWLESDGAGGWRRRPGRVRAGFLDDRAAHARAVEAVAAVERELADAEHRAREREQRPVTVRDLGAEWLAWLRDVKRARPATLRDYEALMHEPGRRHARGRGVSAGRIMAALGDRRIASVTTRDVSRFLRELDEAGLTPRNVNKHRQVLSAMFQYACRDDAHDLPANPVTGSEKRFEAPPAALDYYEPHEIEQLAAAAAAGAHRRAPEEGTRRMDAQDAELFRLLFFTGLRVGEAVALRWDDVDLDARTILVRRAVSAGEEGVPKGRRFRIVPLTHGAVAALERLRERDEFVSADDYVFCNIWGRRLDVSAVRRRYKAACAAAGLRPVKLHGLRHAAGSIAARTTDPVFVRDMLGHAKLSTTDRYVSAKYRPEEFARLDAAFGSVTMEAVKDRSDKTHPARWTAEEIERERRAEQARVRRDAARTPEENLEEVRALTAFATELAEAGKRARGDRR